MDKMKEELLADLNELPADIQNYMRKLAEMDLFMTGKNNISHFLHEFRISRDYNTKKNYRG